MGVWQGVTMDALKFHPGLLCLTLLCPVGGAALKRLYGRFWRGLPKGWAAYGHLLPPGTPHAVRL
jgi:hypothetical protein